MREPGERDRKISVLAYALRRSQSAGTDWPLLDADWLEAIINADALPTVIEQADSVVRWLGDHVAPGQTETLTYEEHGAQFGGMQSEDNFALVIRGVHPLIEAHFAGSGLARAKLTFQGWQRYQELQEGAPSGRKAFIAMDFGNSRLDDLFRTCFRPAVEETGFELRRLDDDNQRAGLIDDQLRVDIQGARFLLAELTLQNRGAYWEAGYAEGLGKPVIYLCEEKKWKRHTTHFDTNHHLHVLWEEGKLDPAVKKLKAVIRATIPDAKRDD